jgi:hypothetical protein
LLSSHKQVERGSAILPAISLCVSRRNGEQVARCEPRSRCQVAFGPEFSGLEAESCRAVWVVTCRAGPLDLLRYHMDVGVQLLSSHKQVERGSAILPAISLCVSRRVGEQVARCEPRSRCRVAFGPEFSGVERPNSFNSRVLVVHLPGQLEGGWETMEPTGSESASPLSSL